MSWHSRNPDETRALARALAEALCDVAGGRGWIVSLIGPLGAGKTQFAKGLAEGLGLRERDVTSPTFVLANEWETPHGRLVHADWYRIETFADLDAAGLPDWLEPGTGFVVEWADRFPEALPADHLRVEIHAGDDADERRIVAHGEGPISEAVLARWRALAPARED